jgi:phenylalanyl-tRNA synthetase beta chain
MKVSEHWLRAYIDIPLSINGLADQLTYAGLEIEDIVPVVSDKGSIENRILSLKIPPNRGDCLSVVGIIREISALNALSIQEDPLSPEIPHCNVVFPVKIEAPEACSRYMGRVIKALNGKALTPEWMQKRLLEAGIRLISPIVDVSNYVMIELGQPLHAFDLNKLNTGIIVRFAKDGESIQLLDGQTLTLEADTLVIADHQVPLAIAGIMGGEQSSVQLGTDSIFLESAFFNPIPIRLTARRYKLKTDSSYRFERTVDPELQARALERATQLILEIMGGTAGPVVEFFNPAYHPKPSILRLRSKHIAMILGVELPEQKIVDILRRLGMKLAPIAEGWSVEVPSFRSDLSLEVDLIEEIARIYGYTALPSYPLVHALKPVTTSETVLPAGLFKQVMVDRGYMEAMTYSFVDKTLLHLLDPGGEPLTLLNPISEEAGTMRTTLLAGLLQAVQYNAHRQQSRIRLFEIGLQYPLQKKMLAGVAMGTVMPLQWGTLSKEVDFYDIKADVVALVNKTRKQAHLRFETIHHPALHPGKAASIYLDDAYLGILGEVHPHIIKALDLPASVMAFELEFSKLLNFSVPIGRSLSKYPSIRRDLALVMDMDILACSIKSAIVKQVGEWLQDLTVFDVYQGKGIPMGKKSMALTLTLQHPTRTLVENEVNELVQGVLQCLEHDFQAILRE